MTFLSLVAFQLGGGAPPLPPPPPPGYAYVPLHTKIFYHISFHTFIPKNFKTGSSASHNFHLCNVASNALTKVRVTLQRCDEQYLVCTGFNDYGTSLQSRQTPTIKFGITKLIGGHKSVNLLITS